MDKTKVKNIITVVAIGLVAAGIATANWTAPVSAPPICNAGNPGCDAPISVSGVTQAKVGALTIGGVFRANSNTGIGTAPPPAASGTRLQVAGGNVRAPDFCLPSPSTTCLSNVASVSGSSVQSIIAGLGIGVVRSGNDVTVSNTGVTKITNGGNLSVVPVVGTGNVTLSVPASSFQQPISSSNRLYDYQVGAWSGGGAASPGNTYRARKQSLSQGAGGMNVDVSCLAGDVLLGGGCFAAKTSDGSALAWTMKENWPAYDGSRWFCRGPNEDTVKGYVEAVAICLKK